jgi:hypothetical protein
VFDSIGTNKDNGQRSQNRADEVLLDIPDGLAASWLSCFVSMVK